MGFCPHPVPSRSQDSMLRRRCPCRDSPLFLAQGRDGSGTFRDWPLGGDVFPPSVQFNSVALSCPTLRPHESQQARPPCPSPTPGVHSNSRPIESVMPSSHLILCRPLLLLPPIPPSIRVFSNESTLHTRWPKYWSFSFSISPSNEHAG